MTIWTGQVQKPLVLGLYRVIGCVYSQREVNPALGPAQPLPPVENPP